MVGMGAKRLRSDEPRLAQSHLPMRKIETPTLRPSLVTFMGGPCHGAFEVGCGRTIAHVAAALALRKYETTPLGKQCRFWGGICNSNAYVENYSIVEITILDGRLQIVCQYDADEG